MEIIILKKLNGFGVAGFKGFEEILQNKSWTYECTIWKEIDNKVYLTRGSSAPRREILENVIN